MDPTEESSLLAPVITLSSLADFLIFLSTLKMEYQELIK
jgi:hypothetical protein